MSDTLLPNVVFLTPHKAEATHRRRCGNCNKTVKEAHKLSECQGCHQECYCSTDCQSVEWEAHREYCKLNGLLVSGTIEEGQSVWQDLTVYIRTFIVHLTSAMLAAYDLVRNPDAYKSDTFVVYLKYAPGRSYKPAGRFLLQKFTKMNTDALLTHFGYSEVRERFKAEDQRMTEDARKSIGRTFGGMGHICYVVQRKQGEVIRLNPVAFCRRAMWQSPNPLWGLLFIKDVGNLNDEEVRHFMRTETWRI